MGMQYKSSMIDEYAEKQNSALLEAQIDLLDNLKLRDLLNNKNPYLFSLKSKPVHTIIKELTSEYIYSNEETMYSDWLEGLAVFINSKVYGGWKSGITGIDLEFDNDNIRNIVTIKSGPNWGNSSQIKKMLSDFNSAKKTLRTSNSNLHISCINGCCYGKDNKPDKGAYFKYCGERFWEFIGGSKTIFTDIIEPLGYKAKEKNKDFGEKYGSMINRFTKEFVDSFCTKDGNIDWLKLVQYNSGKD